MQEALRSYILDEGNEKTELVASAMGQPKNIKLYSTNKTGCSEKVLNLNLEIKEADVHLIPHALDSVERGTAKVVQLSINTDLVNMGLQYWY